jgi:hypothetical protein
MMFAKNIPKCGEKDSTDDGNRAQHAVSAGLLEGYG